jgi:hypothetical protein
MFASDNEHIALMVNMTSVVSSAFIYYSVLVFVDFEKLISRIAAQIKKEDKSIELTSNAIVILEFICWIFILPILIVFGLMLWKQKFTLWLYSSPALVRFTLGTRHG